MSNGESIRYEATNPNGKTVGRKSKTPFTHVLFVEYASKPGEWFPIWAGEGRIDKAVAKHQADRQRAFDSGHYPRAMNFRTEIAEANPA